ncbi:hypothetical protein ACJMK2_008106 [Sinanodonta woodiana]|uniref:Sulfotransferase domain-containing protein n=1 Tax=Sinanodonta woodiana TaxID=1069815 RepID=A0ABD3VKK1_SINWO
MIWSRIRSWFWFKREDSLMKSHLAAQCSRMLNDYKNGLKLIKEYPGRFKFLIYEDLMDDRTNKAKKLYKFLGMNCSSEEDALIKMLERATKTRHLPEDMSRFSNIKTPAFAWRILLRWKTVQIADSVCLDAYKTLGYMAFPDESAYSNYSFVSFRTPSYLSL